ncbi:MAG: FtsL-like putative cell division protein [Bacteroidota bacterium]
MATNTYRLKNAAEVRRGGLFGLLDNLTNLNTLFKEGVPVHILPHILFLTGLGIFYIGNRHYTEKTIRKINMLEVQVEDLRADFTTLKSEYMYATKQSEVAKQVERLGLEVLKEPPTKITVQKE